MTASISDEVVNMAKSIENMDSFHEMDPLEVKVVSSLDGTVREIILVLTIGGPHIEVNVTNQTVLGSWGGDSHTTHVNNGPLCEAAHDFYKEQFESHR